uniref:Uncharacterized protein n=1 Tax=Lotus japonicus TaxID=34305 RepID=I3S9I9_LOTJA|nr:unknown [Lotus japonicus]
MYDCIKLCGNKNLLQRSSVPEVNLVKEEIIPKLSGELLDPVDCNIGGIVKVIDDDGFETAEQELKNGVTTDVTGSTGHQHRFGEHG